ncbi:hypothetical protein V1517DRAFT_103260 [Lipomyces orientalis]|uniref:Uncharacterized protein n=1 Tax=Lipomyces orientalis TaxID=1233043 RepID=A0ACC3TY27_9ASCO
MMDACKRKCMVFAVSALLTILLQLIGLLQLSNVVRLGLPIHPVVPVLAVVLPAVTFFLALVPVVACKRSFAERRFVYPAVVAGEIVFTAHVLARLCGRIVRAHGTTCYEARWQHWFDHKSCKIGKIERALQCCGFSTPSDRAFPFGENGESGLCVQEYGFADACAGKWVAETEMVAKSCMFVFFMVLFASFACLFRWIRTHRAKKQLSGLDAGSEDDDEPYADHTREPDESSKMMPAALTGPVEDGTLSSDDPPSYSVVAPPVNA